MIQTTTSCNAACTFCPHPKVKSEVPQGTMDEDLFLRVVDELASHEEVMRVLPYLMNEPLLDPQIARRVDLIKKKMPWASVHLLTNGLLLPKLGPSLLDSGLDWIGISVHAAREDTYREIMGLRGYEREGGIREGISRFVEEALDRHGPDYVNLKIVRDPRHLTDEEAQEVVRYWRDLGLTRVEYFAGACSRAGNVEWLPAPERTLLGGCNSIWAMDMIHVLFDGSVLPCCNDWRRTVILGNVGQQSIEQVWNGPERREFLRQVYGHGAPSPALPCLKCEFAVQRPEASVPADEIAETRPVAKPETPSSPPGPELPVPRPPHHVVPAPVEADLLVLSLPPGPLTRPSPAALYLTAFVKSRGLKSGYHDHNLTTYENTLEGLRKRWPENADVGYAVPQRAPAIGRACVSHVKDVVEELQVLAPQRIALHVPPACTFAAEQLTLALRRAGVDIPVYWFGTGCSRETAANLPPEALPAGVVVGDPEPCFQRLLDGHDHPPGMMLGSHPQGPFTPALPLLTLDALSLQDLGQIEFDVYHEPRSVEVALARGCSQRCPHCPRFYHHGLLRTRQTEAIMDEISWLHRHAGLDHFVLGDPAANASDPLLVEIADRIIADGLRITWEARYVPRADESNEHYRHLYESGCRKLRFCLQTGEEGYILSSDLSRALRQARRASITTALDTVPVGLPGEDDEAFQSFTKFLFECIRNIDSIETLTDTLMLPGSGYDTSPERYGVTRVMKDMALDWHDGGYLNREFRRKRLKELYLFLSDMGVQIPSRERVFGTRGTLLEQEDKVKSRMRARASAPMPGRFPLDCLLASCPPWGTTDPPVALAYLSSYLRERGYRVECRDLNSELYRQSAEDLWMLWHVENKNYWSSGETFPLLKGIFLEALETWADELAASPAPVIGLSVVDPKERMTIELIRRIKVRDVSKKIILGGPAVYTPDYRQIFVDQVGDLVDGYVIGEGEGALVDILEAVRDGRELRGIPGVLTYRDGEKDFTHREPIMPIDTIPFPDYSDFDMSLYPSKRLILEWSRGCINRCAFCKGVAITGNWRNRSPAHIVEELVYHVTRNRITDFEISDQLINGNVRQLEEICDRIIAEDLDIRWMCQGLPRPQMKPRVWEKLEKAGCYDFKFGLESASWKVIRLMGKGGSFRPEEAERVIRDCHDAGIETSIMLIVGYPGEEDEDFQATYDFIERNAPYITRLKSINMLAVITDTPMHEHAEQFGLVLPKIDYHYLWKTRDGRNTLDVRRERLRRLIALGKEKGLPIMETNLTEGKQNELARQIAREGLSFEQAVDALKAEVNHLGSFDLSASRSGAVQGANGGRPGRGNGSKCPEAHLPEGSSGLPAVPAGLDAPSLEYLGVLDGRHAFKGPGTLELDMTNNCNLACAGCWCHSHLMGERRFSGMFKQRFMPYEQVERLVREAAAMGTRRIQLAGSGEPFMHPQIWDAIRLIKGLGLELTIITNFTLINEAGARELVELGVDDLTCSIWAGTPDAYEQTHPGTDGEAFMRIERLLVLVNSLKVERNKPRIKLYNVISNLNYDDIENMLDFGLRTGANFVEFTPVDTIEGYTDSLRLSLEQREEVLAAFERMKERNDYVDLLGREHLEVLADRNDLVEEQSEFPSRFMKESDYDRFTIRLEPRETRATCPAGIDSIHVYSDPQRETGYVFMFDPRVCRRCDLHGDCGINTQSYTVKQEFLSVLGFGSFSRRIAGDVEQGRYEDAFVDTFPCYVGWIYSRVTTDGDVLPCCKGYSKPLGNLASQSYAEFWNSERMREFREMALTRKKGDPYFAPIQCHKCCDNLGMNLRFHRRVVGLSATKRQELAEALAGVRSVSRYREANGQDGDEGLFELPDANHAFPRPVAPAQKAVSGSGGNGGNGANGEAGYGDNGGREGPASAASSGPPGREEPPIDEISPAQPFPDADDPTPPS